MEKNANKFQDHSEIYLLVNSNSDYYYVKKDENYITKKMVNIDMKKVDGIESIVTKEGYYDVLSGKCVHNISRIYSILDTKEKVYSDDENAEVYLLSSILNLDGNKKSYLTIEDIDTIVNYEKEEHKVYKKK